VRCSQKENNTKSIVEYRYHDQKIRAIMVKVISDSADFFSVS
jgi:hypothetical protein